MKTKILKGKIVNGKVKIIGSITIDTIDLTLPEWIIKSREKLKEELK